MSSGHLNLLSLVSSLLVAGEAFSLCECEGLCHCTVCPLDRGSRLGTNSSLSLIVLLLFSSFIKIKSPPQRVKIYVRPIFVSLSYESCRPLVEVGFGWPGLLWHSGSHWCSKHGLRLFPSPNCSHLGPRSSVCLLASHAVTSPFSRLYFDGCQSTWAGSATECHSGVPSDDLSSVLCAPWPSEMGDL